MKKCPYCAEEIQDEAIICRYCGRNLAVPNTARPKTRLPVWLLVILAILTLPFVFFCVVPIISSFIFTSAPPRGNPLCNWFVKAQVVRSHRISGASELLSWYDRYGNSEPDQAGLNELSSILKHQIETHQQFLDDWQLLGPHEQSQDYWNDERLAVQMRLEAFKKMSHGIETMNEGEYQSGLDLWMQSREIGSRADQGQAAISSQCVKK